jgi:hypothetical protein
MNPLLEETTSGDPSFHIGSYKTVANTKGLVYLQDATLVKPYLSTN